MILVIGGGPRAGKSRLGEELALRSGTELLRTDDVTRSLGHIPDRERWSECSRVVAARILTARRALIVEGVAAWRALRKALDQTDGAPCDRVIAMRHLAERLTSTSYAAVRRADPSVELTTRQLAMARGCDTVFAEIEPELVARGVVIERM